MMHSFSHLTNNGTRITNPPATSERYKTTAKVLPSLYPSTRAASCISPISRSLYGCSTQHRLARTSASAFSTCLQVAYTPHQMPAPNHVCSTKHRQQSASALPLRAFRWHFTRSVHSSASHLELCPNPRAYASLGQH